MVVKFDVAYVIFFKVLPNLQIVYQFSFGMTFIDHNTDDSQVIIIKILVNDQGNHQTKVNNENNAAVNQIINAANGEPIDVSINVYYFSQPNP